MTKLSKSAAIGATALLMSTSAMAMDVKISGFVDFDTHMTETTNGEIGNDSIARDFYIPSVTPTGAADDNESWDMTAQASRLRLSAKQGDVTGFFEVDFFGSQANERVSNSTSPRMRRAFIKTGNLLIGQEWTTFQNLSAIPASASFLAASDAQVFVRQQQIRYTNGAFQVALENPGHSRIDGTAAGNTHDKSTTPDIVLRYNYKGDFGNVSVSALTGEFSDGTNDADRSGFNIAGKVNAGAGDVRFSYVSGEGLGRYVGLHSNIEAYTENSALTAVETNGHVLALRYPLAGGNISIGNSTLTTDNPGGAATTEETTSSFVAYMWNPKPKLTYGVEHLTATKTLQSGTEGELTRTTFSAKYAF